MSTRNEKIYYNRKEKDPTTLTPSSPNDLKRGKGMLKDHGSPRDRGSADAYYGRPAHPHYFKDRKKYDEMHGATYAATPVYEENMTKDEIISYYKGFDEEYGRKDWGYEPHLQEEYE